MHIVGRGWYRHHKFANTDDDESENTTVSISLMWWVSRRTTLCVLTVSTSVPCRCGKNLQGRRNIHDHHRELDDSSWHNGIGMLTYP